MFFVGVGGKNESIFNPDHVAQQAIAAHTTLQNDDGFPPDFVVEQLNEETTLVTSKGQSSEAVFVSRKRGSYSYFYAVSS